MNIDWFTVVAQILNFLILVWLMKKFLYLPVLKAIDERESKITSQLNDAAARKEEAERSKEEFRKKNEDFENQRIALLNKAEEEAKKEQLRLLNGARQEAVQLRQKLQEDLKEEQQRLNREVSYRIQKEVFDLSRKVLNDLASVNMEQQIVEVFVKRLEEMNESEVGKIITAFKLSDVPALVKTSFAVPSKEKEAIEAALRKIYPQGKLKYEVVEAQMVGIELIVNGIKIGWSVEDYLSLIEQHLYEVLNGREETERIANTK